MSKKEKVFISYARNDARFMAAYIKTCLSENYKVFWDNEIQSAEHWEQVIKQKVEDCKYFIFLITDKSLESPYCGQEFDYAVRQKKRIITILLQKIPIPEYIGEIQAIDLTQYIDTDIKHLPSEIMKAFRNSKEADESSNRLFFPRSNIFENVLSRIEQLVKTIESSPKNYNEKSPEYLRMEEIYMILDDKILIAHIQHLGLMTTRRASSSEQDFSDQFEKIYTRISQLRAYYQNYYPKP